MKTGEKRGGAGGGNGEKRREMRKQAELTGGGSQLSAPVGTAPKAFPPLPPVTPRFSVSLVSLVLETTEPGAPHAILPLPAPHPLLRQHLSRHPVRGTDGLAVQGARAQQGSGGGGRRGTASGHPGIRACHRPSCKGRGHGEGGQDREAGEGDGGLGR